MITITDSTRTTLIGFNIDLLPPEAFRFLTVHKYVHNENKIILEAGPYIGTIPLLNGDTLFIAPRIGNKAMTRMLAVINNFSTTDADKSSYVSESDTDPIDWLTIIGSKLSGQIMTIEKLGLRFNKLNVKAKRSVVHGKIDYRRTTLQVLRRVESPVISTMSVRDYSTVENRLLGLAALIVNRGLYRSQDPLLLKWSNYFIHNPISTLEYEQVLINLNKGVYDDYRGYYKSAIKTAILLVPENGIGISFDQANVEAQPFMSNVNLLFEDYVRSIIAQGLLSKGYIVEKPSANLTSLFLDGSYNLIPDILITKDSKTTTIGDVKYKPREETSGQDWYQLKTYLDAHSQQTGFLVRPSAIDMPSRVKKYKYFDGKIVIDISIDVSNYEESENVLLNQLDVLLQ